jgi:alanyl-tRNA synthetase
MNTERLYYADAYCADFAGRVLATRAEGDRLAVALDRTAFYPTGGGQPNDTGELTAPSGRAQVVDVTSDDDLVWHWFSHEVLAADWQAGTPVTGAVDWLRRFDHMQQHTGQHILSQAFIETCGAETVAFHLGVTYSTIDLARADLDGGVVAAAEGAANRVVDRALPVTAGYVTPEELAALPLRRAPKVTENIRIVQVAGFDWSACGGTHVANSSQVGLIKVTATERRGAELRVTFLCGGRARTDYARLHGLAQGLVARFTTGKTKSWLPWIAGPPSWTRCARNWPTWSASGSRQRQTRCGPLQNRAAATASWYRRLMRRQSVSSAWRRPSRGASGRLSCWLPVGSDPRYSAPAPMTCRSMLRRSCA